MAIKFKKVVEKVVDSPLTQQELETIKLLEKYIDIIIIDTYDNMPISIPLLVANFSYDPVTNKFTNFKTVRRIKMHNELNKRYIAAGWKVEKHIDDGLDGPNRSGPDFWVLTGK